MFNSYQFWLQIHKLINHRLITSWSLKWRIPLIFDPSCQKCTLLHWRNNIESRKIGDERKKIFFKKYGRAGCPLSISRDICKNHYKCSLFQNGILPYLIIILKNNVSFSCRDRTKSHFKVFMFLQFMSFIFSVKIKHMKTGCYKMKLK